MGKKKGKSAGRKNGTKLDLATGTTLQCECTQVVHATLIKTTLGAVPHATAIDVIGPNDVAWRLLDVTAATLLIAVPLLPYLGDLVMLSPLGDALRQLASVDSLQLHASCCVGLWLLAAAAALETVAGWLPL